jgi:AraC-like DNA-binding protein
VVGIPGTGSRASFARRRHVGRGRGGPAGYARLPSAVSRQVARVEEAIIGHVGENLDVHVLAHRAGCSAFHLCRIFRRSTGQSLRQFRLQQRLGTALGRLSEGDLAALACDVGFSSPSHMTEAFGQSLGASPSELREELRHGDLARLEAGCALASGRAADGSDHGRFDRRAGLSFACWPGSARCQR